MKTSLLALCSLVLAVLPVQRALSFGDVGHQIVGAAADERLQGKPAALAEVTKLLGPGITLERASTIADELKDEDRQRGSFQLPENPGLHQELLAFLAANPRTDAAEDSGHEPPSHNWFHYTDIPIQETSYAGSAKGKFRWDLVQMIPYCVRVLQGTEKADNPRKITRGVALVLLAHYVGDLHQPLHVGAAYLNKNGELRNPNHDADAMQDRGGNNIAFGGGSLHGYWDIDTVESAMNYHRRRRDKSYAEYTPKVFGQELARREPPKWQVNAALPPEKWAELWADEMLPLAREAHERLRYLPLEEASKSRSGAPVTRWPAVEKPHPGKDDYWIWSSNVIADTLAKAGWRLAALVEASLAPTAPGASPAAIAAAPPATTVTTSPTMSGEAIAADDLSALRDKLDSTVTVEGTVSGVGQSRSGTVRYLNFSRNYKSALALVFFTRTVDVPRERLQEFVGKKVRVTGKLGEHEGQVQIVMDTLEDVKVVE